MSSPEDLPTEEPDQFDRTASMFVDGAPRIGIGGVDIWRSTIAPLTEDEAPPARLSWHVTAIPGPDGEQGSVAILGDLSCSNDSWFLGVTGVMPIAYCERDEAPDPDDVDAMNAAGQVLGPWVSNVLYDVLAMRARQLIASSTSCALEIPVVTPKVHIGRISLHDDDPSESAP